MTQVISFLNLQHGGGKTTTVLNLATALTLRGSNVLAVDLDPEATLLQRVRTSTGTRRERSELPSNVLSTVEGWHLMPADISTALLHTRALYRVVRNTVYHDELRALFDAYDYVLMDCSTAEMTIIVEALALTDDVIVPLDSESLLFLDAIERLSELLAARVSINPHLKFGGVFLAHYTPGIRRAREMLTALYDAVGPLFCFGAYLREQNEIRQAERRRASVITDAPTSKAAFVYTLLAQQVTDVIIPRLAAPAQPIAVEQPLALEASTETPVETPAAESLVALYASSNWLQLARRSDDANQAMRYAVLALSQEPSNQAVIELFETRLMECIGSESSSDADGLVALGRFLLDHGFDHYAAQLFRRATDLNPNTVSAWAGIVQTSPLEVEREHALQMCLQLDDGLAAAEAPELPQQLAPASKQELRAISSAFSNLQHANV